MTRAKPWYEHVRHFVITAHIQGIRTIVLKHTTSSSLSTAIVEKHLAVDKPFSKLDYMVNSFDQNSRPVYPVYRSYYCQHSVLYS